MRYISLRTIVMSKKDKESHLLVKINRDDKYEFYALCKKLDTHASREVRRFVREFIKEHSNGHEKT